ncbi:MAG: hypothetical protein HFJ51_06900, partial [Clostridia bacterium]|nr:hypothetical protein [Clostridia bacterium]
NKTSADNIKYYINDFKKFMKNGYLTNITVDDIQNFINYKRCMLLKDTTVYRYYRMLKTIFNYAISHKYIVENPCCGVKVNHVLREYVKDIDYSKKYIKQLKKLFKNTKLYFFVLLDLHTRYEKSRTTKFKKIRYTI